MRTPMKGNTMKHFKKKTIRIEELQADDHIKIAGVLYRVRNIYIIGDTYTVLIHNARRPMLEGMLLLETNTLMKIWNQQY